MISTIEIDFIQEIKKAGIEPPENIAVDGQFQAKGDRLIAREFLR